MKVEMKTCGKCGSERPDRGRCPECNRERQRKYHAENPDKARERDRKYRAENRDKARKHYEEILDKIRERQRKYHAENPDKIRGELL